MRIACLSLILQTIVFELSTFKKILLELMLENALKVVLKMVPLAITASVFRSN